MPGNDSNTKLLLACDGSDTSTTVPDTSVGGSHGNATCVNDAQLDTAQKKFGTASLLLDGDDYITYADDDDWYYGTGNFTIDFWVKFNTDPVVASTFMFYEQYENGTNYAQILSYNGKLYFYYYESGATTAAAFNTNSAVFTTDWQHVAVVRYGTGENNMYAFIDGDSKSIYWGSALAENEELGNIAAILAIGAENGGSKGVVGWIDEFRISKGVARWTSNFTPPTAAYNNLSEYTETINETITTSEPFGAKAIGKSVAETITTSEPFGAKAIVKLPMTDTTTLSEVILKAVVKTSLLDTATPSDANVGKGFTKTLIETVTPSEQPFALSGGGDETIVEISKNPQISAGKTGDLLTIHHTTDTPKLRIRDGTGISLMGGGAYVMGSGFVLNLVYQTDNSVWQETSRGKWMGGK